MRERPANRFEKCVLLFSGGRDSTIAALRLAKESLRLTLLTVTTDHLFGLDRVAQRIVQIRSNLPLETVWVRATWAPIARGGSLVQSCLPCHHGYMMAAKRVADEQNAQMIATGYSGYQSSWLEQTPLALTRLREVLAQFGLELVLPVLDVASKDEARAILRQYGVSEDAWEQKCLQQQFNDQQIDTATAEAEINQWAADLREALTAGTEGLSLQEPVQVGEVSSDVI